jgi:hypothetical protein
MSVSHADLGVSRYARKAERAQQTGKFDKFARAGYAAKAFLYLVVGGVAARAGFVGGEQPVGSKGALHEVSHHGWGSVMLILIGVGLSLFAIYKAVEAFADPRLKGRGAKNIGKRIGKFGSAIIHGALAFAAFQTLMGQRTAADGEQQQHWTARLMAQPAGELLVGAVGVAVIGYGLFQLVKAYKADIWKHLDIWRMGGVTRQFARVSGRAGYAARGIVLGIIGAFLVYAGVTHDPSQSQGVPGALRTLESTAFGPWVLGVVAIGLLAYAVFCAVRARYFRAAVG